MRTTRQDEAVDPTMAGLQLVSSLGALTERIEQLEGALARLEKRVGELITPTVVPLTVKQIAAKHPAYSEASLRWILFHRRTNGFDRVVIQGRGGRLKIDERAFLDWIAEGREAAPTPQPARRTEFPHRRPNHSGKVGRHSRGC